MYGLVNRAIEQLVTTTAGEAAWLRVCARAGVEPDGFIAMQPYDDDVTYRLVGAASAELGLPAADVLRAFGEYWILYTADEGYGELMNACGSDLRGFLANLNEMHGRVEAVFPEMVLPHFAVADLADGSLGVRYRSQRTGLAPMVEGLLAGLARRFGTRAEVRHVEASDGPGGLDVFVVRQRPAEATAEPAALPAAAPAAAAAPSAAAPGAGRPVAPARCPFSGATMDLAARRTDRAPA